VVELARGRVEARLALEDAQAFAFPPGGRSLVAARAGPGQTLHLARWELGGSSTLVQLELPRGSWRRVLDLSPCGRGIVLAGSQGTVGIGTLSAWGRAGSRPSLSLVLRDKGKEPCFAQLSPDLRFALVHRLALAPKSERTLGLGLYDLETGHCRVLACAFLYSSTRFHFSPDGLWVAALWGSRGVLHVVIYPLHDEGPYWHVELLDEPSDFVWKPGGKAETCGFALDPQRRAVARLPAGRKLPVLETGLDGPLGLPFVRDRASGKRIFGPRYHAGPISSLRLVGSPPRLESFDRETGTLVWCLETGRCVSRRGPDDDPPPEAGRVWEVPVPGGDRVFRAVDGGIRIRPRA
jgi:hypothetical protein